MRRLLVAAFGLAALTLVMAVQANEPNRPASKPDDKATKYSKEELAQRERVLAEQYRKFEQSLLKLKDRLARSDDPKAREQAKIFERALETSSERGIATKFDQLVKALETAKPGSLAVAQALATEAKDLAESIKQILDIISGDGGASAKREERLSLEKLVKELERVIRDQKLVRGQVQAGGSNKEVAGNQQQVTKETKDLLDKIGDKAGQGDPKNAQSEAKEAGKGGKGDNKGEAKDAGKNAEANKGGTSKDAGKNSDANKGGAKSGEASKSDSGAKSSKGGEGAKSDAKGSKGGEGDASKAKDGQKDDPKEDKGGAKNPGKDGEQSKVKTKPEDKNADGGDKGGAKKGGDKGEKQAGAKSGGDKSGDKPPSASKSGDKGGEQGQSKPGSSSSGQGQPKPGQPGQQGGDPGQAKDDNNPKSKQGNQDQTQNAKQRVEDAQGYQKQAQDAIKKNDKPGTIDKQTDAVKALEDAKKRLEDLLRQLREEELERLLAALQARCEKMLAMQIEVYNGTVAVDRQIVANEDKKPNRQNTQTSLKLSEDENKIVSEASKAIEMLEAEGSAVAFPVIFQQVREDMKNVARRLGAVDAGKVTQAIELDIIDTLKEMIEALKKAQKEMQDKKSPPPKDGPPPPQADQKLLDQIAELKMIRSMQVRVNKRTEHYGRMYPGEQANDPDIRIELNQLAGRQEQIFDVTRKIVTGENK